jgi:6-phosphogluconate dehydrogenase
MSNSDIGIYGMGVMGQNLALNMDSKGFRTSVYNKNITGEENTVNRFLETSGKSSQITGFDSLEEFVNSLSSPRKIMLMVKAGPPVDSVIDELLPFLEKGDIIIDGGNSNYLDTSRRTRSLEKKSILFVGMGVSGGEEGARKGPSLMPGGNHDAWDQVKPVYRKIAAKNFSGAPCCKWIGPGGAGHFVKMVHNGIEYADMQNIAEAYFLLRKVYGLSPESISGIFFRWNESELNSYLLKITAELLLKKDEDGSPLVDKVLDSAGQKGTGKWTAITALENGVPLPSISGAVFARFVSSYKSLRTSLSHETATQNPAPVSAALTDQIKEALYASRLLAYAEGFHLIHTVSESNSWEVDLAAVAEVWQGGCIIQSKLLLPIGEAFEENPNTEHLLTNSYYLRSAESRLASLREVIKLAIDHQIPVPGLSAALTLYDSLRTGSLPANIIQAQRDYFGAHTYERTDKPRGQFFHSKWSRGE